MAGDPQGNLPVAVSYTISLFFGESSAALPLKAAPTAPCFLNIDGRDLAASTAGREQGPLLGAPALADLHRRTGVPLDRLREAAANIRYYRLSGGLLQRSVFARSTG